MKEIMQKILEIQELDMKMLRLMRVRKERQKEVEQIESLRKELRQQTLEKEREIADLAKQAQTLETKIQEITDKIKKLESQQSSVKKVDEFNALTQESTALEREKISIEHRVSDLVDRRVAEEELLQKIKDSLDASEASSISLEKEISSSISLINEEGRGLKSERDTIAKEADPELLRVYERLLRNKKDRVIVPIENRACSGCHIALTAQHENVVRKGNNLVFCEHCSRIHYWQEAAAIEDATTGSKRRRRRAS